MKSITGLLGALVVAGGGAASLAADLPVRQPVFIPPPPPPTWTGFYIGLNAGAMFSENNRATTLGIPLPVTPPPGFAINPVIEAAIDASLTNAVRLRQQTSAILGGQAGYNWQFGGPFVVGVEVDGQGIFSAKQTGFFTNNAPFALPGITFPTSVLSVGSVQKQVDWLSTARARLGYSFSPDWLIYATGGLAVGGVKSTTAIQPALQPPGAFGSALFQTPALGAISTTRVGWTAGGGVEWKFTPNWSLKTEYLYYNLGSIRYSGGVSTTGFALPGTVIIIAQDAVRSRTSTDGHIFRVGLNYRFNTL